MAAVVEKRGRPLVVVVVIGRVKGGVEIGSACPGIAARLFDRTVPLVEAARARRRATDAPWIQLGEQVVGV